MSSRSKGEWERAYGSPERVRWVRSLPCCVPGCPNRPSENAHVSREGVPHGMGRKADACQIVPLCRDHHDELHRLGQRSFNDRHRIDVDLIAVTVNAMWIEDVEGDNDH